MLLEPLPSARSFGRLGLLPSALDLLHSESVLLLHSFGCFDFTLASFGIGRLGSLAFVLDLAAFGSGSSLRSRAYADPTLPVLDFLHPGILPLLRSFSRVDLLSSASGKIRLDASPLPPDHKYAGSALAPRSSSRVGFAAPAFGIGRPGPLLFVLDPIHLESPPLLRSMARPGPVILVLDLLHPGFLLFLHSLASSELLTSPRSVARFGSCFSACGLACFGLPSPLLEHAYPESVPPLQSTARSGLAASVPDFLRPGLFMSARSMACFGSMLLVTGTGRLALFLPVLDSTHPGSSPTARSAVRPGLALLVLDLLHSEFLMFPHSFAKPEPTLFASGLGWMGFPVPVMDFALLGPAVLLRSFARSGLAVPILDTLQPGSLLPSQHHGRPDFLLSPFGCSCMDLSTSAPDLTQLNSGPLLQSFARLGLALLTLDLLHLGLLPFMRSPGYLGLTPSASQRLRFEPSPSVSDFTHPGFSLSLQSFMRGGFAISAWGMCRAGLPPPLLDSAHSGLAALLRSFSRTGSAAPAPDFLQLGLPLLLQSFACMGSAASAPDPLHLGPFPSIHSPAWLDASSLVPDHQHVGSSMLLRSLA